jgi:hypothetical protein
MSTDSAQSGYPKDTVLFLGSGVTAGSGIRPATGNGYLLPSDKEFFADNSRASHILNTPGSYPALQLARSLLPHPGNTGNGNTLPGGLYGTWNQLYLARSFGRSDILKTALSPIALIDELKAILDHNDFPPGQEDIRTHYVRQKRIYELRYGPLDHANGNWAPAKSLDELFALAIWELRHLVVQTYSLQQDMPRGNRYADMWNAIGQFVSTVVNLNYDTTFDDALESNLNGIPLFRPHGSVKWSRFNKWAPLPIVCMSSGR